MTRPSDRLIPFLEAYVRAGSTKAAARELGCHPQTMKARLAELRQETGYSNTARMVYAGRAAGWLVVHELEPAAVPK